MVYVQENAPPHDIWRVRVAERAASLPGRAPEKLIASNGSDSNPSYSPDGRTLAWPAHEAPSAGQADAIWSALEFDQSTPAPAEWDVGA